MPTLVSALIDGATLVDVGGVLKANIGTTTGTVAAGNDSRLAAAATAVQPAALNAAVAAAVAGLSSTTGGGGTTSGSPSTNTTASAAGTYVYFTSGVQSAAILDGQGNSYTIGPDQKIYINLQVVTSSSAVIILWWSGTTVYQYNSSGATYTQPPMNMAGTLITGTSPIPSGVISGYVPPAGSGPTSPATPISTSYVSLLPNIAAVHATPTLHITNWSGFTTTSTGDSTHWANSIPPGANRYLNQGTEDEWYCDPTIGQFNPFSVDSNNNLVISARLAANTGGNPANHTYNSGVISSQTLFNQQYGFFSCNMILADGNGWWPAFWLLPSSLQYTGENDIMERFGSNNGAVSQTIHGAFNGGQFTAMYVQPSVTPDVASGFHSYACDWRADSITYYVDGQQTGQFGNPDGLNTPCYIILNLAVFAQGSYAPAPNSGAEAHITIGELLVFP